MLSSGRNYQNYHLIKKISNKNIKYLNQIFNKKVNQFFYNVIVYARLEIKETVCLNHSITTA